MIPPGKEGRSKRCNEKNGEKKKRTPKGGPKIRIAMGGIRVRSSKKVLDVDISGANTRKEHPPWKTI